MNKIAYILLTKFCFKSLIYSVVFMEWEGVTGSFAPRPKRIFIIDNLFFFLLQFKSKFEP